MIKQIIPFMSGEIDKSSELVQMAMNYDDQGADAICFSNYSSDDEVERFLKLTKQIVKTIDVPVIIGVHVARFEDVKKAFYTGAKAVLIRFRDVVNKDAIAESVKRFGCEQIIVDVTDIDQTDVSEQIKSLGVTKIVCTLQQKNAYEKEFEIAVMSDDASFDAIKSVLSEEKVESIFVKGLLPEQCMPCKYDLKTNQIETNTYESELDFGAFKLDSNGLIPAIVQDYKTNEVLMLGYMNEESFRETIKTGRMTYFSRSRQKLWIKGETSSHYQYVKELSIDCDKDTILAKVRQVGAACHTGNRSCFYTRLMKKEWDNTNPYSVFEDVYHIIMDRKFHPKEGSYTNYLFDKGIDKILKKCGEEATEIVIAAKNPEVEELKYEISDFLYHCMVLMAERGVDWDDITKELAHRR